MPMKRAWHAFWRRSGAIRPSRWRSSLAMRAARHRVVHRGRGARSCAPMSRAAGKRRRPRRCRIRISRTRRTRSTPPGCARYGTISSPPRGARHSSASTASSCMRRTATCCTSFCHRWPTSARTHTAAVWRTGCASRWRCSMRYAPLFRHSGRSGRAFPPPIGCLGAGTLKARWNCRGPADDRGRPHHRTAASRSDHRRRRGGCGVIGPRHVVRPALALACGGCVGRACQRAEAILALAAARAQGFVRGRRGRAALTTGRASSTRQRRASEKQPPLHPIGIGDNPSAYGSCQKNPRLPPLRT